MASSIVPSFASVVPSSSFVLPANLPIRESPHLLSIPSSVPIHFECDEVDDDFMDLPIRSSHSARLDPVPVPIQFVSLHRDVVITDYNELAVASINRVSESIDLFPIFIPICEDLVIDSDDEYDSEKEENTNTLQVPTAAVVSKGFQKFLSPNVAESTLVQSGGRRKRKGIENWASNMFNEWRAFRGFPMKESLADLSELPDVKPFAAMLKDFFLECVKRDGTLYPPSS